MKISLNKKQILWKQQQERCFYCLINIPQPQYKCQTSTADHILPHSVIKKLKKQNHNYKSPKNNFVIACNKCNKEKDDKIIPPQFIEKRRRIFTKPIDTNVYDVLDKLYNEIQRLSIG